MSVEDVLHLSSIFEGDEATKEFMRKRILALESAIHQQGLRFQHEVEEYRRLANEEETLLSEANDISAILDVISAHLQQTSTMFQEKDLCALFLKDVKNYKNATKKLLTEIADISSQIAVMENWKKDIVAGGAIVSASKILAKENELHEATAKFHADKESLATLMSSNAKLVIAIEEAESDIKLVNESANEVQGKILQCKDEEAKIAVLTENSEQVVTDMETQHNDRIASANSKTQEVEKEFKVLSTSLDELKSFFANKVDRLARIMQVATEFAQKLEALKLTETSLLADVELLNTQSLQAEKIIFERGGKLQSVKMETEGHRLRLESSQSTKATMTTSAEALASECSHTAANLANIEEQIEVTKKKLDTRRGPIESEHDCGELAAGCQPRSELSCALQRIEEKKASNEEMLQNVQDRTEALRVLQETLRDIGIANDGLLLRISNANDDTHSLSQSRDELMESIQGIQAVAGERSNEAALLAKQKIRCENLQRQLADTNSLIFELGGKESALEQNIIVLRNDLDNLKTRKEEAYLKNEIDRLFLLQKTEFLNKHNEKVAHLNKKISEEDTKFQEMVAKAQNIVDQSEAALKVQLEQLNSEGFRHIEQRDEQRAKLQESITRHRLLEESATVLGISITLSSPIQHTHAAAAAAETAEAAAAAAISELASTSEVPVPESAAVITLDTDLAEGNQHENPPAQRDCSQRPTEPDPSLASTGHGQAVALESCVTERRGHRRSISKADPLSASEGAGCSTDAGTSRVEQVTGFTTAGQIDCSIQQAIPSSKKRKGAKRT